MLKIILKFSGVGGGPFYVFSSAVGLVVADLSLIVVSVGVEDPTSASDFVMFGQAVNNCFVGKHVHSLSMNFSSLNRTELTCHSPV